MRPIQIETRAQLAWRVARDPASEFWVASCDALALTVQGETYAEMNESIGETLQLLFEDLIADNEFSEFLSEHGWRLLTPLPAKPDDARFDVPWDIVREGGGDPARPLHQ